MTMQGIEQIVGETAYDAAGEKVGSVGNVYTSDATGSPEWVTVNTGLFGSKQSFAPLDGARVERDGLHLAPTKSKIKDAPRIDADGRLSEHEASELYRYYGVRIPRPQTGRRQPGNADGPTGTVGQRTETRGDQRSGAQGDRRTGARGGEQDESMIRSEERLRTGTETVESGRVSLHKYVVTEEQQVTVPVRHEEARVVREPLAEGDPRHAAGDIGEEDREVVLHEERPVVAKETVPVERVGLETEAVQDEEQVSETVRKEQVEVKGLPDDRDPKRRKKH